LLEKEQQLVAELKASNRALQQQKEYLLELNQKLQKSEDMLNRSQRMAKLGSWELDLSNDHLFWSDEVYRIFGLQPQEFAATYETFLERVHPDDRKAVDEAYTTSLDENRDGYDIVHRVVKNPPVRFARFRKSAPISGMNQARLSDPWEWYMTSQKGRKQKNISKNCWKWKTTH